MFFLIALSVICNIAPMVILPLAYDLIPDKIPAYMDFFGNTVSYMEKSYITIFRLPMMGLLMTIICIIMYSTKLTNYNKGINKIIWSVVAFIGTLKMGITSMEILFYDNIEVKGYFRTSVWILVVIGVLVLISGIVIMHKNKITFAEYRNKINSNRLGIFSVFILYVIFTLMPMYIN